MPKQPVTDLITDQEIAFARLVLSGTMTDRQAAEAAGLNPDTAAYTKAKPRVRDWMREHRAAAEQQLLEQEAGQELRRSQTRERVLARLWEIAGLAPSDTRNSASAQVKALSLIIAIEGLIPVRAAASPNKKPASPPVTAQFYRAAWLREQEENPDAPATPEDHQPLAASTDQSPEQPVSTPAQPPAWTQPVSPAAFVPDAARAPFSIHKPFAPPRLGHRRR